MSTSPIGFYSQLCRYLKTPNDTPKQKGKLLQLAEECNPSISWNITLEKLSSLHFDLRQEVQSSREAIELIRAAFADLTVLKGRSAQRIFYQLEEMLKVSPGVIIYTEKKSDTDRVIRLHVSDPGRFFRLLPAGIGSMETGLLIQTAQ